MLVFICTYLRKKSLVQATYQNFLLALTAYEGTICAYKFVTNVLIKFVSIAFNMFLSVWSQRYVNIYMWISATLLIGCYMLGNLWNKPIVSYWDLTIQQFRSILPQTKAYIWNHLSYFYLNLLSQDDSRSSIHGQAAS